MKALGIAIIGMALLLISRGNDMPFSVVSPSDSMPLTQSEISEEILFLIAHLREPKESEFIASGDAKKALKWRVGELNIVSPEVVAVAFNEGHVVVIGIYVRNHKRRAWDLKAEVNGTFKVRSFSDDSLKTTKEPAIITR